MTPTVPTHRLKVAVMGAGAVGCYYGGMLARAGHDVTLIGRPALVDAVTRHGLRLDTLQFCETVHLHASTDAAAVRDADCVLVCVKSTDTDSAGAAMAPHLAPQATVLSLQNGVDNAPRLSALLKHPVLPAVVYVATGMAGPGHVQHHGRGELLIGPAPGAHALATTFTQASVPVQVSDQVTQALWTKLVVNCAYNALSALCGVPYGQMVQGVGVRDTMRTAVDECLAVAAADGVALDGDSTWHTVEQIAQSMPTQRSSTWQDLQRSKPTEIDHLNGYVVRRGQALGLPTPVNLALHALVKLRESHPQRS